MAIACRPATPAPRMSARAGVIVPAAVIINGKMRGSRNAAITAAWYPASVAIDESTSMSWARLMRGIASSRKAVTPPSTSARTSAGSPAGSSTPTRIAPRFSWPDEAGVRAADDHDDVRVGEQRRAIRDDLGAHLACTRRR